MTTIKYNDNTFDLDAIPQASVVFLAQRGLTHFLGNEMASKGTAYRKRIEEGRKNADGTWAVEPRELREGELETFVNEKRDAAIAAILSGEFAERGTGSARLSLLERTMRAVAWERLAAVMKEKKVKQPVKEARQALIDKYLAKYAAEVETEAKRRIESTDTDTDESLDDILGL